MKLQYQSQIINVFKKNPSTLAVTGLGLDTYTILEYLIKKACKSSQTIMIFGVSNYMKQKIILKCEILGIPNLPQDIEYATLQEERINLYKKFSAFFISPSVLAKDMLLSFINPKQISSIIIMDTHNCFRDTKLQFCLSFYKTNNFSGHVKALSDDITSFRNYSLSDISKLLWIERSFIFSSRNEDTVNTSLMNSFFPMIIDIPLQNQNDSPINISGSFMKIYSILSNLQKELSDFIIKSINDKNKNKALTKDKLQNFSNKYLESQASSEKQQLYIQSYIFIRDIISTFLTRSPIDFCQQIHSFFNNANQINSFPMTIIQLFHNLKNASLTSRESDSDVYEQDVIPSPKHQQISMLLFHKLKKQRVLILSDDENQINYLCDYLNSLVPSYISVEEENSAIPNIEKNIITLISRPSYLIQDMSEPDIIDRFMPDAVIFVRPFLKGIRSLEVYNAKNRTRVPAYILNYNDGHDIDEYQRICKSYEINEDQLFMKFVKEFQNSYLTPLRPITMSNHTIIIDDREFRSPMPNALYREGLNLNPVQIQIGDYVLSDQIAIERKAFNDLVESLRTGRLVKQIRNLNRYYQTPILLLEFSDIQFNSVFSVNNDLINQLMIIIKNFPKLELIWTKNAEEASKTIYQLCQGQKEPDLQKVKSYEYERPKEFLQSFSVLSNVDKIKSNCNSIKDLINMDKQDLIRILDSVDGERLYRSLHAPINKKLLQMRLKQKEKYD